MRWQITILAITRFLILLPRQRRRHHIIRWRHLKVTEVHRRHVRIRRKRILHRRVEGAHGVARRRQLHTHWVALDWQAVVHGRHLVQVGDLVLWSVEREGDVRPAFLRHHFLLSRLVIIIIFLIWCIFWFFLSSLLLFLFLVTFLLILSGFFLIFSFLALYNYDCLLLGTAWQLAMFPKAAPAYCAEYARYNQAHKLKIIVRIRGRRPVLIRRRVNRTFALSLFGKIF